MKITVKIGHKEGFVSSYNLFLPSGLRLTTVDLTWKTTAEKEEIKRQFDDFLAALYDAGFKLEGGTSS